MTLYIIGNGFDLNHGLETSYWNYRVWLESRRPELVKSFEHSSFFYDEFYDPNTKWTDLEKALEINFEEAYSDLEYLYPDLSSEKTPGWDDIKLEVDNNLRFLFDFAQVEFFKWINEMNLMISTIPPKFLNIIDCNSRFVSFNYTEVLEKVYRISANNILHIHGSVSDCSSIQFGNPNNYPVYIHNTLESVYSGDEFYTVVHEPAITSLKAYAIAAYKNLNANIAILSKYIFESGLIDKVVVMGHSFMGIDKIYYSKVIIPLCKNAEWTVFSHDEKDRSNILSLSSELEKNVQIIEW